MLRILFFILSVLIPVTFGWWLFIPFSLLLVYLTRLPYEILFAAIILDSVYYFGEGFLLRYPLALFSLILILIAFFLSTRIHWKKRI